VITIALVHVTKLHPHMKYKQFHWHFVMTFLWMQMVQTKSMFENQDSMGFWSSIDWDLKNFHMFEE
jgi:hypothetical protein